MEQRIANIEKNVGEISKSLTEFISFTKQQFEKQENILEELKAGQGRHDKRLESIEETMAGIQRAFSFKTF